MKAFERLAVSTWIKQFKEPLFKNLTVSEYLWGYEDSIIKLKSLGRGRRRFGLLMSVS